MAEQVNFTELLESKGLPKDAAQKISLYVNDERRQESGKDKKPVTNNSTEQIVGMAVKYWNMGLVIDGIDVVITGKNMAMVTFHGYKNKVLRTYPESEFDFGLMRDGDTFNYAKESGSIVYSHQINDTFGDSKIIGAYVVIKNKRGEYLEALNKSDYEKMQAQSKQSQLWNKWASEFWLKSVMKRACKRHFNDIVAEIDRDDNEQYGGVDIEAAIEANDTAVDEAIALLQGSKTNKELKDIFFGLDNKMQKNKQVFAAKGARKAELAATGDTGTVRQKVTVANKETDDAEDS